MWIDVSIVLISLFGIDVPVSGEGIRLISMMSRAEANDKVELGEELQPADFPSSQEFGGCKILQVFVVDDDVNWSCRAFKIMVPGPKGLMDSEELLVMSVIIELQSRQGLEIVDDRPNLLVRTTNGENASDGIAKGVCLHDDWSVQNPMSEDRSGDEDIFKVLESGATGVTEVPGNTFVSEAGQQSDDTGVVIF